MGRRRGALRFVRRHRLGFVALLALAALVLGFIGYLQAHRSVVDAAYGTLSLLAFNYYGPQSQQNETIPATLEVARFIVPAVAALATFTALVALLEDQWHLVRARFCREHVVVCGLGRRGHCLVRSLREGAAQPATVVAIESNRANPNVEAARRLGAVVVIGDATDPDSLLSAGLKRAVTLVSVLPDDAHNASVASIARDLCVATGSELTALCHVTDLDLAADLTAAAIGGEEQGFALEWFSIPERAARLMLVEHAGLLDAATRDADPHVVVVGADELTRALLVNAARQWRALAPDGRPLRVTVVAAAAGEWLERFSARHPSAAARMLPAAYEDDLRAPAHADRARQALDDASVIFVCGDDDAAGLELGFAAHRALSAPPLVVVRLQRESAFELLELPNGARGGGTIRLFGVVERTCSAQMITDGLNETLARALHDVYRRHAAAAPAGEDDGRPTVAWDRLGRDFRRSSRAQARHLASKLRESGCAIRPLTDWDPPLLEFEPEEVERLAKFEHERWNRERKSHGWVAGPVTDRERRVSAWIDVPWEDLPPEVADYDREFVRALPGALAAAGYEIYRPAAGDA